jgi:hypothetical protein
VHPQALGQIEGRAGGQLSGALAPRRGKRTMMLQAPRTVVHPGRPELTIQSTGEVHPMADQEIDEIELGRNDRRRTSVLILAGEQVEVLADRRRPPLEGPRLVLLRCRGAGGEGGHGGGAGE